MSKEYILYRSIVAEVLVKHLDRVNAIRDILRILDTSPDYNTLEKRTPLLKNLIACELNCFRLNKMELEQPEDLDSPCIEPFKILNSLPGITTTSSCSGHGSKYFEIYFYCNNPETLFFLRRCIDPRYWNHGQYWEIAVEMSDVVATHPNLKDVKLPLFYVLRSKSWERLFIQPCIENLQSTIESHLNNFSFIDGYHLWGLAKKISIAAPNPLVDQILSEIEDDYLKRQLSSITR